MAKVTYIEKNFQARKLETIGVINEVIEDFQAQGFTLTLRQLYYQLVGQDLFPDDRRWSWDGRRKDWYRDPSGTKNADPNYKWLGGIVNDGRLGGYIDWDSIEDRTRNLIARQKWNNPREIGMAAWRSYKRDRWENQICRPEVWVEKEALVGIVAQACHPLDVDYMACRGYMSQSEMRVAALRLADYADDQGQVPFVIHLGDHDPSGVDMTRDNQDRMTLFAEYAGIEIDRIALNWDQIEQYAPPPDPAKITDSRAKAYIAKFGDSSWELDALSPSVLVDLISSAVLSLRDDDVYDEVMTREEEERARIRKAVENM